jgi:hypothetical protein
LQRIPVVSCCQAKAVAQQEMPETWFSYNLVMQNIVWHGNAPKSPQFQNWLIRTANRAAFALGLLISLFQWRIAKHPPDCLGGCCKGR